MSFLISELHLQGFRNYQDAVFAFDPTLTIVCGANAVGKTSIIEAIQILCEAVSFRKSTYQEMVRHGCQQARLTLHAYEGERRREVVLDIEGNRKTYRVNQKKANAINDVLGVIPTLVFTPDNLRIIKDGATKRREAVDMLGQQLSKTYAHLCREYTKTLKGRNRLLGEGKDSSPVFGIWTEQLVSLGAALHCHRAKLLARLIPLIQQQHAYIDPDHLLEIAYVNNWCVEAHDDREHVEQQLRTALALRADEEHARKITLVGPHRDDVSFLLDRYDVRSYGSQGQQRTIALSWKLAEVDMVESVLGVQPLLLLDDVMSELDESRRNALTARVGCVAQTIITTTNIGYFEPALLSRAHLIEIGGES